MCGGQRVVDCTQGLYSDRYAPGLAELSCSFDRFLFKTHVNILHVATGIVFVGTVGTRC